MHNHEKMKRRYFFKSIAIASLSLTLQGKTKGGVGARKFSPDQSGVKPALRIAHISDVHLRADALDRFKQVLIDIQSKAVDLILNTGDSVFAVNYENITRERVYELWDLWDESWKGMEGLLPYSCLGNHDMWWAAPDESDPMYGKPYAVKRLGIPHRYYGFNRGAWHFIVLDGNNSGVNLDEEQYIWLEQELAKLPARTPVLLMSHYPILSPSTIWKKDYYANDYGRLKKLFYQHKDKVRLYLAGHTHLLDKTVYNGVTYLGNGAVSGYWWGEGNEDSAGPYYMQETPPGYAILDLYEDGEFDHVYHPQTY